MMRVSPARGQARTTSQKQKTQQSFSWPAPVRGLSANGSLAVSQPGAAYVLDNFFCTATGAVIRRGHSRYATLGEGDQAVRSIFSYFAGGNQRVFAANDDAIYDITTVENAYNYTIATEDDDLIVTEGDDTIGTNSTEGLDVFPNTSGDWITVQTEASTGQAYLVGVNGTDDPFVFDGTTFYPMVSGGVSTLGFDAETDAFQAGDTITGGTSGATALIVSVTSDGSAGTLVLRDIASGPFVDDEAITGAISGAAVVDGTASAVPATDLTFAGSPGIDGSNLLYVWSYKERLFFVEKDSLNVWYTAVGSIGGELNLYSLGGQFKLGGSVIMGATWSRDTGSGLAALCAFFSSQGEVAIYQGDNPGDAAAWSIVGVYRIGNPLGKRSIMEAGGDLVIATDIGLVPLSVALTVDTAVLSSSAISEAILDLWNEEVELRGAARWNVVFWPRRQMVAVALPTINDQSPKWLVVNARTKGWSTYSGWDATCVHAFGDRLFFGDDEGGVYLAETTGSDEGNPYTAVCLPMFDQMGVAGYKTVTMLRAVFRGPNAVSESIVDRADYNARIPAAPSATPVSVSSTWGDAVWGESEWAEAGLEKRIFQRWRTAFGGGEVHSPLLQITSGANVPLDAELIRIDSTFTVGDVVF